MKLIGYSSDDLIPERYVQSSLGNINRFGKPLKSKKERREEKSNSLFSKTEPLELDEWFIYLVDGEKWFYKAEQDLNVLRMHHEVSFLGKGKKREDLIKDFLKSTEKYEVPIGVLIPEKLKIFNKKPIKPPLKQHRVTVADIDLHVYLIKGEKHYWSEYREIDEQAKEKNDIVYLGIEKGKPNKEPEWAKCPSKSKIIYWQSYKCCYCEIQLNIYNYTREHLIPKHRGGRDWIRNMRPCCAECNSEKDNMMLHTYIQYLNLKMAEVSGDEFIKLQTKIINANRLAKEIEKSFK